MTLQSNDEIIRVFDDWTRNYCPPNVVKNAKNSQLIAEHCFKKHGIVTISGLTEAVRELASQLEFVKEPSAAEIAAKQEARMRKDYADSLAHQSTLGRLKLNQEKADADKRKASEKEHKTLLSQIESEISNFCVGHASGHLDYSRTESGRDALRKVRDGYDHRTIEGARAALSAVRAAKNKLS